MNYQVFICHSSKDAQVAGKARAALEDRGIGCWIAPRDVLAGLEYGEAIIEGIAACSIVLIIFSSHANASPQVRREIERSVSKGKTIVPFRIEDVLPSRAMEYGLSSTHWMDAIDPPVEAHLPALCKTIATLIERSAQATAPAATPAVTPAQVPAAAPATNTPHAKPRRWLLPVSIAAVLAVAIAITFWVHRANRQRWAREEAIPQFETLKDANKRLAAFDVLQTAQRYLPDNSQLKLLAEQSSTLVSIHSEPSGANVEIADYSTPTGAWHTLGVTPLNNIRIPNGYFRWRISKPGVGEIMVAPELKPTMNFDLAAAQSWPKGMVLAPGGQWGGQVAFLGWVGPYKLPPYYVDRYEVTNRDFQAFVDSGGYAKPQFWPATFTQNGRTIPWQEGMAQFRDTSGRPGPATWTAGHFPEGKADFPVSGVSWYEASAYAAYAGKSLPVLAQWLDIAPPYLSSSVVPISNMGTAQLAAVGSFPDLGPFGTYDTAGNLAEWVANAVDDDQRFTLGGSWKSPGYQYFSPEAVSPFNRSDENGFRCVKNLGPLPPATAAPLKRITRDFTKYKPVPDSVFDAYKLLYAYPKLPLNAVPGGLINETADWREEKVTIDTGYRGQRMAVYLFLPKNVQPPYQTVLFFPSARIYFNPDNKGGRQLGDIRFFDYVVQSGRAVAYPIYESTYERKLTFSLPSGSQKIELTTDWYKDGARTLDYLNTRSDIDSSKLAFLGVSMGSADGIILASLMQDRFRTAVLLDGGYFMDLPPAGADQADFVTRMKLPTLLVNGRYDYTFPLETAQNPFFAMLGTPPANKSHIILDTPHDVTEQRNLLTHAVLDWLDHYLGRVQ